MNFWPSATFLQEFKFPHFTLSGTILNYLDEDWLEST